MQLNTLGLVHEFLRQHVKPGAVCIDATAGRGRDTALLCRLAGESGRVLAFDIQKDAIDQTRALLAQEGYWTLFPYAFVMLTLVVSISSSTFTLLIPPPWGA